MSLRDLPKAFVNRKVNTKKQNDWLRIRWIRVSKDESLQFRYRYSHNPLEQWKVVDLKRRTKGRPPDTGHIVPKKPYMSPRSIKSAKKKDLLELLNFVPPIYHAFYQDLVSEGTEDDEDESEHEDSESEENEPNDQEDND